MRDALQLFDKVVGINKKITSEIEQGIAFSNITNGGYTLDSDFTYELLILGGGIS